MACNLQAVVTAGPIWLMIELEQRLSTELQLTSKAQTIRMVSFITFLVGYAGFLICNVTKYETAHYVFVTTFALGFAMHAYLRYIDLNRGPAKLILVLGILAFLTMLLMVIFEVDSIAFWAVECVGFTMLLLFTPVELYVSKQSILENETLLF